MATINMEEETYTYSFKEIEGIQKQIRELNGRYISRNLDDKSMRYQVKTLCELLSIRSPI